MASKSLAGKAAEGFVDSVGGDSLFVGEAGNCCLANRLKGCCPALPGYSLVKV